MRIRRIVSLAAGGTVFLLLLLPGLVPVEQEQRSLPSIPSGGDVGTLRSAALAKTAYFPELPDISAGSMLLADMESGEILYAFNADTAWAPASLTKLFTMYEVLQRSSQRTFPLERYYPVPEAAYAGAMEPGSSLMFLGPGQRATGEDLLLGLVVSSGNDSAVALALLAGGDVKTFMRRVNGTIRGLGLTSTRLVEPSGISAQNVTTARDLAQFARLFVLQWPDALNSYLAVRAFTYPRSDNFVAGASGPSITQTNRNTLLWDYPGTDGMKTGYIDESGYNIIATAVRDGRRLIAVVLGVEAENHRAGGVARSKAAAALLDWGFTNFSVVELSSPTVDPLPVRGSNATVIPVPAWTPVVNVTPGALANLHGSMETDSALWAPIDAGTRVGLLTFRVGGSELIDVPLIVNEDVNEDRGWVRYRDRYRTRVELLFDN